MAIGKREQEAAREGILGVLKHLDAHIVAPTLVTIEDYTTPNAPYQSQKRIGKGRSLSCKRITLDILLRESSDD